MKKQSNKEIYIQRRLYKGYIIQKRYIYKENIYMEEIYT